LKSLRSAALCLAALTGIVALAAPPAIAQSAPATSQAATASAPAPLVAPPAESVKAYDRPSDDGSMIIVEWARPEKETAGHYYVCLLYTSPSPRDRTRSRMPSSA